MICPQCQCPFETSGDSAQLVHHCPQCSGTWIGGRSLHTMLAQSNDSIGIERILDSILDLDFRKSQRLCPRCTGRHLKVVMIENTELDFCSTCKGLFFDPGELERVLPVIIDPASATMKLSKGERHYGFWRNLLRMLDER